VKSHKVLAEISHENRYNHGQLQVHPPDDLYAILQAMKARPTGSVMDKYLISNTFAKDICRDLSKRANRNYYSCLGIPILPASEVLDVKDYINGIPGFIGIDSKEEYAWDSLSEDLVAFLAGVADLLHNSVIHNLIIAFQHSTKVIP
jgi:hypothetical protein